MSIEKKTSNSNEIQSLLNDIILELKEKNPNIAAQLDELKSSIDNNNFSEVDISDIKQSLEDLKNKISNETIDLNEEIKELVESLKNLEEQKTEEVRDFAKQIKKQLKPLNPSNPDELELAADLWRKKSAERVNEITQKIAQSNIPIFSSLAQKIIEKLD